MLTMPPGCVAVIFMFSVKESISDFYWYYSGKEIIDDPGKKNFSKAMLVAKQIFNSLTEYIQVPGERHCLNVVQCGPVNRPLGLSNEKPFLWHSLTALRGAN